MTRNWEYLVRIISFEQSYKLENALNALGDEGWELVIAVNEPDSVAMLVVLKREKR